MQQKKEMFLCPTCSTAIAMTKKSNMQDCKGTPERDEIDHRSDPLLTTDAINAYDPQRKGPPLSMTVRHTAFAYYPAHVRILYSDDLASDMYLA